MSLHVGNGLSGLNLSVKQDSHMGDRSEGVRTSSAALSTCPPRTSLLPSEIPHRLQFAQGELATANACLCSVKQLLFFFPCVFEWLPHVAREDGEKEPCFRNK